MANLCIEVKNFDQLKNTVNLGIVKWIARDDMLPEFLQLGFSLQKFLYLANEGLVNGRVIYSQFLE
jgi:hypothetical protein